MKKRKQSLISVRLDDSIRTELFNKAKKEPDHNVSSILRYLIVEYLDGRLPVTPVRHS
jgi:hypothetical protein